MTLVAPNSIKIRVSVSTVRRYPMQLFVATILVCGSLVSAFQAPVRVLPSPLHSQRLFKRLISPSTSSLFESTVTASEVEVQHDNEKKPVSEGSINPTKPLGLITFDLDDTLYPIKDVLNDANAGFSRAMANFGYSTDNIHPLQIVETSKAIRNEIAATQGPAAAAVLTHTEIRLLAIRREMEEIMLRQKLQDTADDWATAVTSLSPVIVSHAKK